MKCRQANPGSARQLWQWILNNSNSKAADCWFATFRTSYQTVSSHNSAAPTVRDGNWFCCEEGEEPLAITDKGQSGSLSTPNTIDPCNLHRHCTTPNHTTPHLSIPSTPQLNYYTNHTSTSHLLHHYTTPKHTSLHFVTRHLIIPYSTAHPPNHTTLHLITPHFHNTSHHPTTTPHHTSYS